VIIDRRLVLMNAIALLDARLIEAKAQLDLSTNAVESDAISLEINEMQSQRAKMKLRLDRV